MSSFLRDLAKSILPPSKYAGIRDRVVEAVSRYKRPRYFDFDDRITILFEDAVTVWFQIEEALFLEGEEGERLVEEAVRSYAPIIPSKGEVSMTVMVNLYKDGELKSVLPKYVGVEKAVYIGGGEGEAQAKPVFPDDYGPGASARSIHYLKAPAPRGGRWLISLRHPAANGRVQLPGELVEAVKNSLFAEEVEWAVKK